MSQVLSSLRNEDLSLFTKRKLKKGEILFLENEKCESIGILKDGSLNISSYTFEGKEMVFNTIHPDMMFGNNLIFSKEPYYKGNVLASIDSEVYLIDKESLLKILGRNKSFLNEYLTFLANDEISLHTRIKMLSFNSLSDRLSYLFFLNKGILPYKSISALSKELNVERETLSRYLSKLVSEGLIKKKDHRLIDLKEK